MFFKKITPGEVELSALICINDYMHQELGARLEPIFSDIERTYFREKGPRMQYFRKLKALKFSLGQIVLFNSDPFDSDLPLFPTLSAKTIRAVFEDVFLFLACYERSKSEALDFHLAAEREGDGFPDFIRSITGILNIESEEKYLESNITYQEAYRTLRSGLLNGILLYFSRLKSGKDVQKQIVARAKEASSNTDASTLNLLGRIYDQVRSGAYFKNGLMLFASAQQLGKDGTQRTFLVEVNKHIDLREVLTGCDRYRHLYVLAQGKDENAVVTKEAWDRLASEAKELREFGQGFADDLARRNEVGFDLLNGKGDIAGKFLYRAKEKHQITLENGKSDTISWLMGHAYFLGFSLLTQEDKIHLLHWFKFPEAIWTKDAMMRFATSYLHYIKHYWEDESTRTLLKDSLLLEEEVYFSGEVFSIFSRIQGSKDKATST